MKSKKLVTNFTTKIIERNGSRYIDDFFVVCGGISKSEAAHMAQERAKRYYKKEEISKVIVYDTSHRTFEDGPFYWECPIISISLYGYKVA